MTGVTLDPENLTATLGERSARLTRREYGVLALLANAEGATVGHKTLLDAVWRENAPIPNLRVAIANLRRKLEPDPELPSVILAVPGEGYRLDAG